MVFTLQPGYEASPTGEVDRTLLSKKPTDCTYMSGNLKKAGREAETGRERPGGGEGKRLKGAIGRTQTGSKAAEGQPGIWPGTEQRW